MLETTNLETQICTACNVCEAEYEGLCIECDYEHNYKAPIENLEYAITLLRKHFDVGDDKKLILARCHVIDAVGAIKKLEGKYV